jgi:hypothetical protein
MKRLLFHLAVAFLLITRLCAQADAAAPAKKLPHSVRLLCVDEVAQATQLILAENQSSIASALSLAGAAHLLDRTELNIGLCAAIDDFFHYPEQLFCMSRAAANVVDGKGAERVAQYLCEGASA